MKEVIDEAGPSLADLQCDPPGLGQAERRLSSPRRILGFRGQASAGPRASGDLRSRQPPEISENSECLRFLSKSSLRSKTLLFLYRGQV